MHRFGIIGTGRIAYRFVHEAVENSKISFSAIYNKRISSAEEFVKNNKKNLSNVFVTDNIDSFLDNVDCVYIATPHDTHYEYIEMCLNAGKHVLCEKPMVLASTQAKELFDLAEKKNLVLMEAIKTAYYEGFQKVLELCDNGEIGNIISVEATFTKLGNIADREMWGESGGSFVELGSYVLLPVVKLLGREYKTLDFWSSDSATYADEFTRTTVKYDNSIATIKTGLGVKSEGELIIAGDLGYIRVPSPWWISGKIEVHYENSNATKLYEVDNKNMLGNEAKLFLELCETKHILRSGITADVTVNIENNTSNALAAVNSIWISECMEKFLESRKNTIEKHYNLVKAALSEKKANIWAHRGCCSKYPENTLLAFKKAADIKGIAGIETDIQLTKDGEIVVIHDETIDRCTTGTGYVRDYTLSELKRFDITASGHVEPYYTNDGNTLHIPTLREMLDLLLPYIKEKNLKINLELKNSVYRYEGMEEKVLSLVKEYGIEENIIYSSFNHESMKYLKELNPSVSTGLLDGLIINCINELDVCNADAFHIWKNGMPVSRAMVKQIKDKGIPIRMWTGDEPFFGDNRQVKTRDLQKYTILGATDIITNVPELYLS